MCVDIWRSCANSFRFYEVIELTPTQNEKELRIYQWFLALGGTIYLLWWEGIHLLLPQAFNPLFGRALAVLPCFVVLVLSFKNAFVRRNVRILFAACSWIVTLHYFYLFYQNDGEGNWVIGTFITVTAFSLAAISSLALLSYSALVGVISIALVIVLPELRHSVFLPGIATILIQANIALRFRLGLMKALADTNERFRLVIDSAFEGILVHDNGRIIDVNKAILRLTGRSREELVGRSVLDIVHPNDRAMIVEKIRQPEVAPYESQGLTKDGRLIDIEIRAKEFRHADGVARLVTVQDITDRKRADRERIKNLAMTENVRVRDEFISLASHELKTPISSLKLQTQLIQRSIRRDPNQTYTAEQMMEFASVFHRQIDRLTELVDTMLDVSRISSGGFSLDLENVDLPLLVNDVISTLQVQNLYEVSIEAPDHLSIRGDASRLKQVIENLLTNTTKYGEGKPVRIQIDHDSKNIYLKIVDQGLGIAPESIDRIFNRFERAVSAENISGLGLGLYIARQIVEAHGGTIAVESRLGIGSIFTIVLPINFERPDSTLAATSATQ